MLIILVDYDYSSSRSCPNNRYVCQVVYTVKPSNIEWVMHFLAAKRLNVLLEVSCALY